MTHQSLSLSGYKPFQMFKNSHFQEIFDRQGYVIFEFLEPRETEHLLRLHRTLRNNLKRNFDASLMVADLEYRVTVHREIENIFRTKIDLFFSNLITCACGFVVKKAMSPDSELQFHQDMSFIDESSHASMAIWCPLVDVSQRNGGLRVVAGSHKLNRKPRAQVTPAPYRELFSSLDAKFITEVPMKTGQAIVYSHQLFHGSASNLSLTDRIAAYAVMVPHDSRLRFYYQDIVNKPDELEVFEVNDGFYLTYVPGRFEIERGSVTRYVPGVRPVGFRRLGVIDFEFELLTRERLELLLLN
jgi:hypothetical protein